MKIRELYSDSSKWSRNGFCRDKNGRLVPLRQIEQACSYCLMGAIIRCYIHDKSREEIILDELVTRITEKLQMPNVFDSIYRWNDDSRRTFQEVKQLVEELDI